MFATNAPPVEVNDLLRRYAQAEGSLVPGVVAFGKNFSWNVVHVPMLCSNPEVTNPEVTKSQVGKKM